jgi:hypothetical protein
MVPGAALPRASGEEKLRSHLLFQFVGIELGKAPLLGDTDVLATRKRTWPHSEL